MRTNGSSSECLECRPHQLMCVLCRLGAGDPPERLKDQRLNEIFQAIRGNPRFPVRFTFYAGNDCVEEDEDSPSGVLFHMYQDEKILEVRRSRNRKQSGLEALLDASAFDQQSVCWHDSGAPSAWRGCPLADEDFFALGGKRLKEMLGEILPVYNGAKSQEALDAIKEESAEVVLNSDVIRMFPSHLPYVVAMAFQYECRQATPVHHDNLWEPAEAMRRNPEIPVMFVPDHCMVCPPCKMYDMEGCGLCRIKPLGLNLVEKMRSMGGVGQLSVLRSLGLEYYQKIPAHRLLRLAQERLTADHYIFNYDGAPPNYHAFERTLNDGLGFLDAFDDVEAVVRRVETLLDDERVVSLLPEDERRNVETTLSRAKRNLTDGKRKDAYLALTESAFAHTWKQYMELIPAGYARLPESFDLEAGDASDGRVLTVRSVGDVSARSQVYSAGFVTMINVNRPAIAETGLRVEYDQNDLRVHFACADVDVGALKADARLGLDLENVGRKYDRRIDDAVLFVVHPEPDSGKTFLFTVNPKGVKLGERSADGKRKREWIRETEWEAEVDVAEGVWTVVMTIPFSLLGVASPAGATWAMNARRYFRRDMLDQHSWSPMTTWNLYDPKQCGRLEFWSFERIDGFE